jgi:sortase A
MWKFHKSTSSDPEQKQGRKVVIWIERILLVSGLALAAIYGTARIESILTSRAALKKFAALETSSATDAPRSEQETAPAEETTSSARLDLPDVDFSLWGQLRVQAYKQSVGKQSGVPLAVLRILKINLEAPLFEGTDDITLNHALGRIAGTARPGERGNIGIAGHRDGFFRGLKDVSVGDTIELKTLQGTDTYIVDQIQIVRPNQVEVLKPRSVPSLTLVTCYPFYFLGSAPQRYIVTASLTGEKKRD